MRKIRKPQANNSVTRQVSIQNFFLMIIKKCLSSQEKECNSIVSSCLP